MSEELKDLLKTVQSNNIVTDMDLDFDTPDLEEHLSTQDEYIQIEDESGGSLKFGIIGLGQCGNRLAETFYKLGYKKTIVINTSQHDLTDIDVPTKLKIGNTDGAGKSMDVSGEAFSKEKANILHVMNRIFGKDVDHIIICAGAGGGTGSGTVIPAIELSKLYMRQLGLNSADSRVGAIVTIPTNAESSSPLVKDNSLKVLTTLSDMANNKKIAPLIIIDNDKVKQLFPKLTVTGFYPTINKTIIQLFHTFNVISTKQSDLISFDKADYNSIITSPGHMVMGGVTVKDYTSSESISRALRSNIENTLLAEEFDLESAKVVGIIAIGGKEIFDSVPGLMNSIEDAFGTIGFLTGDSVIHRGLYMNNSNSLKVFTLIGGMSDPVRRYKKIMNT
jgi:cell division GTPase FtsZ